jgi:hypothetical protein
VPHLEHPLAECQANAGGKKQVIILETRQRIAQVAIAVGDLPAEPVFQLGRSSGVKLEAVRASVRDVGVEAELFGERGAIVDLGVEGFAQNDFAGLSSNGRRGGGTSGGGESAEEVRVVAASCKNIESRGLSIYDVIAQAAADYIPQVEVLKLVVLEVGETKDEELVADVQVAPDATTNGVSGGGGDAVDRAIGVDGGGVDRDLVAVCDAGGFADRLKVSESELPRVTLRPVSRRPLQKSVRWGWRRRSIWSS